MQWVAVYVPRVVFALVNVKGFRGIANIARPSGHMLHNFQKLHYSIDD